MMLFIHEEMKNKSEYKDKKVKAQSESKGADRKS